MSKIHLVINDKWNLSILGPHAMLFALLKNPLFFAGTCKGIKKHAFSCEKIDFIR